MYLIVGLGNPGSRYALTPHNVGFMVCDLLSFSFNFNFAHSSKFKGYFGSFIFGLEKIAVLKPATYMNLSGESVSVFLDFYKIELDRLIVIHDDIDMEFGKIKIKKNSTSGGHRGVESIISSINSKNFTRIKIGVGKDGSAREHVLSTFNEEELKVVKSTIEIAKDAALCIIDNGLNIAMNRYNNKKQPQET
jgi:PTH1 family peptidyl-tRNA hydrolase